MQSFRKRRLRLFEKACKTNYNNNDNKNCYLQYRRVHTSFCLVRIRNSVLERITHRTRTTSITNCFIYISFFTPATTKSYSWSTERYLEGVVLEEVVLVEDDKISGGVVFEVFLSPA